jgi:thiamine pyrophosphate-dependent acetolactate synthase large subunit-like protein
VLSSAVIQGPALLATNFNVVGRATRAGAAADSLAIEADAEASLPGLIEEVRTLLNSDKRRLIEERTKRNAEAHAAQRADEWEQSLELARRAGTALGQSRTAARRALAAHQGRGCVRLWTERLHGRSLHASFNMDKPHSYLGQGAGGMGYGAPATVAPGWPNSQRPSSSTFRPTAT